MNVMHRALELKIAERPLKIEFEEINRADINLSQLRKNIKVIKSYLKPETRFMGVVKGNAYGHGLVPIAEELERCGCYAIGVVRLIEAMTIREAGIKLPVLIMAPSMPSQVPWIVENDITPMVDNEEIVAALDKHAGKLNKIINVHVKVNTGLNRYGIEALDAVAFITGITRKYSHVNIEGIYTHFKNPEYDWNLTNTQLERFKDILRNLEKAGLRPSIAHAAGSAGILLYPEAHFDMVRCGLILYGIEYKEGEKSLPKGLESIMTIKSRILKIDNIRAGQSGGYGSKFIANRDSKIAVVGIGYGDGISRGWKQVLIGGHKVPIVSYFMDGILADITDVDCEVKEFDVAVLVGSQRNERISWEDASYSMNLFMDEQLQRITERVPKHYFYEQ